MQLFEALVDTPLPCKGGATFDVCSMFLVTVPPFLALYFGLLYLQTTLDTNKNIVDRWQGERSVLIRVMFAHYLFPRIDKKVTGFNRRVENIILHLRSQQFQDEVNDFTEEVVSTFSKVPIPRISFQSVE